MSNILNNAAGAAPCMFHVFEQRQYRSRQFSGVLVVLVLEPLQ